MTILPANCFDKQKLHDMLYAKSGSRRVDFRYELLRGGAAVCQLNGAGSVRFCKNDAIKRTAQFSIQKDERINWLTDHIKPYMLLQMDDECWAKFSLGVFVPSSPAANYYNGEFTYDVEAYDLSVILQEDCLTERLSLAQGTPYLQAVENLLVSAGILQVMADPNDDKLLTAREFEIGTPKLEVINTLLQEINFNTLSVDTEGVFRLTRYKEPAFGEANHRYLNDEMSVLKAAASSQMDLYSVPNVFIGVVSSGDLDTAFASVYVNDNPTSPLSTVRRGRKIVSPIYKPDMVASQEALDVYVRKMAFDSVQVYETVTFETALMPDHAENEVLQLSHPCAEGIYFEEEWEMPLQAGQSMTHQARRLVVL